MSETERRGRGPDKKPRKKRTDGGGAVKMQPSLPEGYNTRMVAFIREITPTEPLDPNDVAEMERRFARYLQLCEQYDMKVGNMQAYAAIGITKDKACEWVTRRSSNRARYIFIKKVQSICGMYREMLMQDGKINPVTGIFWQKNYDGMKDQQDVVLTPNNPLGDQPDTEKLKQRYLDTTYGVLPERTETAQAIELPADMVIDDAVEIKVD